MALVLMARQAVRVPPVGDTAVIENYVQQVLHFKVFLGPYSRFEWHHPGPLYFFLLAPFYVMSGYRTAGLSAGAVAINLGASVGTLWVLLRARRSSYALVVGMACLLFLLRFGDILGSPWNPHVLPLPLMFLVVLCAGSVDDPLLLPLVAVVATFLVQTHVGVGPTAVAVIGCALLMPAHHFSEPDNRGVRHRFRMGLMGAALLAVLLWCLPVAEEVSRSPGNLTQLWRFFTATRSVHQPFVSAFDSWSGAFTGLLRPEFRVPWGSEPPAPPGVPAKVYAVVQLALLGIVAFRARRDGDEVRFAFASSLIVASIVSFWSVSRIPEGIIDHEVFWIVGLGVLSTALIAADCLTFLARGSVWLQNRFTSWACLAVLVAMMAVALYQMKVNVERPRGSESEQAAVGTLFEHIQGFLKAQNLHKPVLDMDGPAWGVAAGLIVEFGNARIPVAVGPGALWMFGDSMASDGDADCVIAVSATRHHQELVGRAGAITIAERAGFFADALLTRR